MELVTPAAAAVEKMYGLNLMLDMFSARDDIQTLVKLSPLPTLFTYSIKTSSRLAYEQFAAFLANVKELNSQKQSEEDTLRKADEILGPENKDLYAIFERLITRNFS
nr:hypothetical protein CTI12_AA501740 [Tanacetum cinerariifolium]